MLIWVLFVAASLAQHAQQPGSQRQTFVSPDGVFRISYPRAYILNTKENANEVGPRVGVSYFPICSGEGLCVVSPHTATPEQDTSLRCLVISASLRSSRSEYSVSQEKKGFTMPFYPFWLALKAEGAACGENALHS